MQNIRLTEPGESLDVLSQLIQQGVLSKEQSEALTDAVLLYYENINPNGNQLHWIAETQSPLFVKQKLAEIPKQKRLAALLAENQGTNLLQVAVTRPEILKATLDLLPTGHRWAALLSKTKKHGDTVFHQAVNHPESLSILLDAIPAEMLHLLIQAQNADHKTLLHKTNRHPHLLSLILQHIPEENRLAAIQVPDNFGQTVLHYLSLGNHQSVITTLTSLPIEDRAYSTQLQNHYGQKILHLLVNKPDVFRAVIGLLPRDSLMRLLAIQDDGGNSVLHLAAQNTPELIPFILELYPNEKDKMAAIEVLNQKDQNAFKIVINNPDSLEILLEVYEPNDRLTILEKHDPHHYSVLSLAEYYPKSLKTILRRIPTESWPYLLKNYDAIPKLLDANMDGASNLYAKIDALKTYGAKIKQANKGEVAEKLADELNGRLSEFLLKSLDNKPTSEEMEQFKGSFKTLINQHSEVLNSHRQIWKPIIANILIALTGVGVIAIAGKTAVSAVCAYVENKPLSINNCLFFGKTRSQTLNEEIEHDSHKLHTSKPNK